MSEHWRLGVTIGIPVYNEELFVEAAIRSAAPQCEVLLVADNCSTDRSADICQALAREFSNLVVLRHASNQGAASNFKFVMTEAKTPYFMWLGAHDLIPPTYVQHLRGALDADATASLAFGAVTHIDRSGKEVSYYAYPFSSLLVGDDPANRLRAIVRYLSDCSLIHGLFRTQDLKAAWQDAPFLGGDHVLLARMALAGKLSFVPATSLLRRDVHLSDSLSDQLERITGAKQGETSRPSKQEMQKSQYRLVTQVSRRMGWRAPFFRLSAYYWLVSRWGPFSEQPGRRRVEGVAHQFSRGLRLVARATRMLLGPSTIGSSRRVSSAPEGVPLRILYIANDHVWGGASQVVLTSAAEMARRGHTVCVAVAPGSPLAERCSRLGGQVAVLPLAIGPNLGRRTALEFIVRARRHRQELIRVVRERAPGRWDVVHLQYLKEKLLATGPLSDRGFAVVWTEHGGLPPWIAKNWVARAWYLSAARRARGIAAVSEFAKRSLVCAGVDASRVRVVRNGVDEARFSVPAAVRSRWREEVLAECGWSDDSLVVGTACRLTRKSGVDILLRACVSLFPSMPRLRLLVVGDGPALCAIKAELPVEFRNRVVFTGFTSEVPRPLGCMDAFVSPSKEENEGFSLRVVEAMMAGLPVIASSAGGQPELIEPGRTGILLDECSEHTLRLALETLMTNRDMRLALGNAARASAHTFSIGSFADTHERFLLECGASLAGLSVGSEA